MGFVEAGSDDCVMCYLRKYVQVGREKGGGDFPQLEVLTDVFPPDSSSWWSELDAGPFTSSAWRGWRGVQCS